MADWLIQLIQWTVPSGGVGIVLGWLLNRSQQKAESAKTIHNAYKEMYEDVSRELVKLNNENNEIRQKFNSETSSLRRAINRLVRAIEAIQKCPHSASCPVYTELSNNEGGCTDCATERTIVDSEATVRNKCGSRRRGGTASRGHNRTDSSPVGDKGSS